MTPNHPLSEILKRRHRTLARALENPATTHDIIIAAGEEIQSIEYWLRITEEAERSARFSGLFGAITNIVQAYDERLMGSGR
jgi:hypothetical protein